MLSVRSSLLKALLYSGLLLGWLGDGRTLPAADEPLTVPVWPGAVPGETGNAPAEKLLDPMGNRPVKRLTNVSQPTLTLYRASPEKATGTAVLICPGGGYHILAMDLEGEEVAQWFNSIGVTALVLKYRVPRREGLAKHELPLKDAQRAVSLARSHAKDWGFAPDRLGILGFSAGGHLATTTSTNFDRRSYDKGDAIDELSCRPDFTVLIYPAYLLEGDKLAPEIRVSPQTPPMFLAHAYDDGIGPENSLRLFLALKEHKVPAEVHVYTSGGHGFGLRKTADPSTTWPARCEDWLRTRGLLTPPKN